MDGLWMNGWRKARKEEGKEGRERLRKAGSTLVDRLIV